MTQTYHFGSKLTYVGDTQTSIFTTALFTITEFWNHLWMDEQTKKQWFICTVAFYSARKKKKEILSFARKWI